MILEKFLPRSSVRQMSLLCKEQTWSASWNDNVAASGNALPTSCDTTLTHTPQYNTTQCNKVKG